MFYSIVSAIFCVSMISATLPPRDVYSAVIVNAQNDPVDCRIIWSQPTEKLLESDKFTVTSEKPFLVSERVVSMGTWDARATIQEIRCGQLSLKAPFEGVSSPSSHWRFRVEDDQIVSVGSSERELL